MVVKGEAVVVVTVPLAKIISVKNVSCLEKQIKIKMTKINDKKYR